MQAGRTGNDWSEINGPKMVETSGAWRQAGPKWVRKSPEIARNGSGNRAERPCGAHERGPKLRTGGPKKSDFHLHGLEPKSRGPLFYH